MIKFEDLTDEQKNEIVGDWQAPAELMLIDFASHLTDMGYPITTAGDFHEVVKNCGDERVQKHYGDLFLMMMEEKEEYIKEKLQNGEDNDTTNN